jgi:hypothetical protein
MTRECPVRFCERLGVKLPGATLPGTIYRPLVRYPDDAYICNSEPVRYSLCNSFERNRFEVLWHDHLCFRRGGHDLLYEGLQGLESRLLRGAIRRASSCAMYPSASADHPVESLAYRQLEDSLAPLIE